MQEMQETQVLSLGPGSGRSPGGGHGNSLQYSCIENSMDRGLVQNWEGSTTRLYIVTLLIKLLCRVRHEIMGWMNHKL